MNSASPNKGRYKSNALVSLFQHLRGHHSGASGSPPSPTHSLYIHVVCFFCTCPNRLNLAALTVSPKHSAWAVLMHLFLILSVVVTPNDSLSISSLLLCLTTVSWISPFTFAAVLLSHIFHLSCASIASHGWPQVFKLIHLHYLYALQLSHCRLLVHTRILPCFWWPSSLCSPKHTSTHQVVFYLFCRHSRLISSVTHHHCKELELIADVIPSLP